MWMDSDSDLDSICSDSVSDSDSNISGLGLDSDSMDSDLDSTTSLHATRFCTDHISPPLQHRLLHRKLDISPVGQVGCIRQLAPAILPQLVYTTKSRGHVSNSMIWIHKLY